MKNFKLKIDYLMFFICAYFLPIIPAAAADDFDLKYSNGFELKFDAEKKDIAMDGLSNGQITLSDESFKLAYPGGYYDIKYFGPDINIQDIYASLFANYKASVPTFGGDIQESKIKTIKAQEKNLQESKDKQALIKQLNDLIQPLLDIDLESPIDVESTKSILANINDLLIKQSNQKLLGRKYDEYKNRYSRLSSALDKYQKSDIKVNQDFVDKEKDLFGLLLKEEKEKVDDAVETLVKVIKETNQDGFSIYSLVIRSIIISFRMQLIERISRHIPLNEPLINFVANIKQEKKELDEKLEAFISDDKKQESSNARFYDTTIDYIMNKLNFENNAFKSENLNLKNQAYAVTDYLIFLFLAPYVIDSTRLGNVYFENIFYGGTYILKDKFLKSIIDKISKLNLSSFKELIEQSWQAQSQQNITTPPLKLTNNKQYESIISYIIGDSKDLSLNSKLYIYGSGFSGIKFTSSIILSSLDLGIVLDDQILFPHLVKKEPVKKPKPEVARKPKKVTKPSSGGLVSDVIKGVDIVTEGMEDVVDDMVQDLVGSAEITEDEMNLIVLTISLESLFV